MISVLIIVDIKYLLLFIHNLDNIEELEKYTYSERFAFLLNKKINLSSICYAILDEALKIGRNKLKKKLTL